MKTILTLAALAAALAGTSAASAHEAAPGHWEWRTKPSFGPKAIAPSLGRVWVKDSGSELANCDCSMMKPEATVCMMDMSAQGPRAVRRLSRLPGR